MRIRCRPAGLVLLILLLFGFVQPESVHYGNCEIRVQYAKEDENKFNITWNSSNNGVEKNGQVPESVHHEYYVEDSEYPIFVIQFSESVPVCEEVFSNTQYRIKLIIEQNKRYFVVSGSKTLGTKKDKDCTWTTFKESQPILPVFFSFVILGSDYQKNNLSESDIYVYNSKDQVLGDRFKTLVLDYYGELQQPNTLRDLSFVFLPKGFPSLFQTFSGLIYVHEVMLNSDYERVYEKMMLAQAMTIQYTHIDFLLSVKGSDFRFSSELAFLLSLYLTEVNPKENLKDLITGQESFSQIIVQTFSQNLYNRVYLMHFLFKKSTFLEKFREYKERSPSILSEEEFLNAMKEEDMTHPFPEDQNLRDVLNSLLTNNIPLIEVSSLNQKIVILVNLFYDSFGPQGNFNFSFPITVHLDNNETISEWLQILKKEKKWKIRVKRYNTEISNLVSVESPCPYYRVIYRNKPILNIIKSKFENKTLLAHQKIKIFNDYEWAIESISLNDAVDELFDMIFLLGKDDEYKTLDVGLKILTKFLYSMRQSSNYDYYITLWRLFVGKFHNIDARKVDLIQSVGALFKERNSLEQAKKYTREWLKTGNISEIPAYNRRWFICAALRNSSDWEMAFNWTKKEIEDGRFDTEINIGIACTENKTQIESYLEFVLDIGLPPREARQFLIQMGGNRIGKNMTWEFIFKYKKELNQSMPLDSSLPFMDTKIDYFNYWKYFKTNGRQTVGLLQIFMTHAVPHIRIRSRTDTYLNKLRSSPDA